MKKKLLLSVLSLLFIAAITAQTNTSYENAQQITPGETVTSVLTPGSVESLWYKVDVKQGVWYEKQCTGMTYYTQYNPETQSGTEVPTYYHNYSYKGFVGCGFQAPADATYYVNVTYSESMGTTLDWKLDVVSDNRICERATDYTVGETVVPPTTEQDYTWYKIVVEKEKYYRFKATNAHLKTYGNCNSNNEGSMINNGNHDYKATADMDVYIRLEDIKEQAELTITETSAASNTSAATATPLTLGETIQYSYVLGVNQWYKFNAVEGKTYDIEMSFYHQQGVNAVSVYQSDGTTFLASGEIYKKLLRVTATETGMLYVLLRGGNDSDLKNLTVIEVNDNRICANATPFTLGETVSYTHETLKELWWKVELEAESPYKVNFTNGYQSNATMQVYKSCDNSNPLKNEINSFIFTTTGAGVYYFKANTRYSFVENPTNSFSVTKIENGGNTSCENAETIQVGEPYKVLHQLGDKLWYKVALEAGKTYEFDGHNSPHWMQSRFYLYKNCGGEQIDPGYAAKLYYLTPTENSTYYIEWQGTANMKPYNCAVNEVSDNRICDFAVDVTPGTDVTIPAYSTERSPNYWYKVNLQAEKVYELDFTQGVSFSSQSYNNDSYMLYSDCNHSNRIAITKSKRIYTMPKDATIYFKFERANSGNEPIVWSISETEGDNRLCAFATQATPDNPITVSHAEYDTQWYKIDLTKNTLYEVNLPQTINNQAVNIYHKCANNYSYSDWNKHGWEKTFSFTSDSISGEYYIKFSNSNQVQPFDCTISEVKDNRSCLYPVEAIIAETTSVTGQDVRWFTVALNAGSLYEFDFTTSEGNVSGEIYNTCNDKTALIKGQNEKILFKPTATATYLVQTKELSEQVEEWSWAYRSQPAGDNRLCDFATPITTDTTTVEFKDGIKQHWYTVNLKAGKYYELGAEKALTVEFYTACEQSTALAYGTWVYAPKEDITLYVKTKTTQNNTSAYWYAIEVEPDGRFCEHGLPVTVGTEVGTGSKNAIIYFPKEERGAGAGTWYHFQTEKAGTYEIRMEGWDNLDEYGAWHGYWEMWMLEDCTADSIVATCGHVFNTGKRRFNANNNTDYKIFVSNWERGWNPKVTHTWKIVEIESPTGILGVSLAQEDGTIMPAQDANVILYEKTENGVVLADTLTYQNGAEGNALFNSKGLSYGTYLLYAENIGKGYDFKTYLPGWYQNAGLWEDATEISLNTESVNIEFRPNAAPNDIESGDVSISGKVSSNNGASENLKDISIRVYKEKIEAQDTPQNVSGAPFRVVNSSQWETVANTKTDVNGAYTINNLPEGHYKIFVDLPGYTVSDGGIVLNAVSGEDYANNDFEINEETKSVKNSTTGINELECDGLILYPNPVTSELHISNYNGNESVQIFDMLGSEVLNGKLLNGKLNVNQLPNGIYIVKVANHLGRFIKKDK